ncbi:hypothetical protein WN48_11273 [Eufriesea mexicana]|uniref:Uncharacterized protein n=1 Tax=Eufriesea mexicana TaxID=516756 RepID=A0A310SA50_9HYME|nr:hypothetical protein WN48_11273 [Eufriesea mexicana]
MARNMKEAAYVSREKDVWLPHGNMKFSEEMENEQLELGKYKSCRNNGLWHLEMIVSVKTTLKGGKR